MPPKSEANAIVADHHTTDAVPVSSAPSADQPGEQFLTFSRIAHGIMPRDHSGHNRVVAIVSEREQQVREGDAGRRLSAIRSRAAGASKKVTEATSALESAEREHFAALASDAPDADAKIESCRNAVLSHQSQVAILEAEAAELQRLVVKAQAAAGLAALAEKHNLVADIKREALQTLQTAESRLAEIFSDGEVLTCLRAIVAGQQMLQIAGDVQAFTAQADRLNLSRMFGHGRPLNHVSLQGLSDQVTPDEMRGLCVMW